MALMGKQLVVKIELRELFFSEWLEKAQKEKKAWRLFPASRCPFPQDLDSQLDLGYTLPRETR